MTRDLDVITIGRSSVDLYGAQVGGRLEDMRAFDKYVGGSPTNMATGTARLGLKSALITRVGDEHMGRFLLEELAREGVETAGIVTDPERLTALVLLGIRDQQHFPLIFYRENCADMALCEDDIDPSFIARSRAVVATGTHLSHPRTEAAVLKALRLARDGGARTALDIDYRPNLWGLAGHGAGEERFIASAKVTEKLQAHLDLFDLIVGTEEEFHIAGGSTDTIAALRAVRAVSAATLVCKRGAMGAAAFGGAIPDSLDAGEAGPGFPIEVFNVLGAGDGFMSGLLKGWLDGADWPTALTYANACGALAVSRHGCTPAYPSWKELRFFLDRGVVRPDLRNDAALEQVHWATNRSRDWPQIRAFAFDHRMQLEALPGADAARIGGFKTLCLQAALKVQAGRPGYGILCDDRLGREALWQAAGTGLWIGRPVELPGSRPLEIEPAIGPDFGGLAEWPAEHVVKCLCFAHPDDDAGTWARQEETVRRLFHAARRNRLEFLLELIPSKVGSVDDDTTAESDPALLRAWHLSGLVEAGTDGLVRRLGGDLCRHRAERSAHARHRHPWPCGRRGGAEGQFRCRGAVSAGQGLRGRPHDLRRRGRGLHGGPPVGRGSGRDDGRELRAALRPLGRGAQSDREAGGMTATIRLTAAQAMVRYLCAQMTEEGEPFIAGVWAIFGHGNVAGIGEALHASRDAIQTWRGHNEQTMAHAAIAYAKQMGRRRAMAVTSSIGPGATNMVTAAALAHVNRLPVLLVPADVFASRGPDPVLQQVEAFGDGTISVNDCFRPVSRYFDRITRAEQLLTALPRAFRTMTDPADCGPVTLAFCQDVQTEAFDWPESFFAPTVWRIRRPHPDPAELEDVAALIRSARSPVIVAGGGVHYSGATRALADFAQAHGIPVVESQAGKSALAWDHEWNFGPVGVTGATSANTLCEAADLVIGVGTRFQDFTTGSWGLFKAPGRKLVSINVAAYDAMKHGAVPLCADAGVALEALGRLLGPHRAPAPPTGLKAAWFGAVDPLTEAPRDANALPTDQQVIGAVQRAAGPDTVVMCAAGTMPGELHKLWKASRPGGYHMEYGYSCMGYEIAGAIGIKMAEPDRDVVCMLGDGSYMMANSELATAVMMGIGITVVLTDNRGFGCINRLQMATGGAEFNNLLDHAAHAVPANIDFAGHAASMGAAAVRVASIAELEAALAGARAAAGPFVVVIGTDPYPSTPHGGHWWDVAVPEVSSRPEVRDAREGYETARKSRIVS